MTHRAPRSLVEETAASVDVPQEQAEELIGAGKDKLAPVLLNFAMYSGTLAAARCLGQHSVPVTVADPQFAALAKWSKYVSRRVSCPSLQNTSGFLSWVLDFGRQHPGYILYPTSDDMAWFIAEHRDSLSAYFRLYSPALQIIKSLLDKESLDSHCRALGIATPETHFPRNCDELRSVANNIRYPALIKLRSQVYLPNGDKGSIADTRKQLEATYMRFVQESAYTKQLLHTEPAFRWPMVQRYFPGTRQRIYGLSGFVDDTGELHDMRASIKVLQYPRSLGVGVCFEETEVIPELQLKVLDLCRHVGYWGVFEVEFVWSEEYGYLLTDFNPRYYNQMWFDVVRSMPLPLMAYYGAIGDRAALRAVVEESRRERAIVSDRTIVHKFLFWLMFISQLLRGRASAPEAKSWRRWYKAHAGELYDFVAAPGDPGPAVIDALVRTVHYIRFPRGFINSVMRDR